MHRFLANFRSPIGLIMFLGTAVAGLAVDLWTKSLAVAHLKEQAPVRFITHWLHFTYTENRGAVFGMGQGQRALFILVSMAAVAFLFYLYALSAKRRFYQILLGMLLAGVLGNFYDRLHYGYVRDMIYALPGFYWPEWIARHLPADLTQGGVFPWIFNVADMLLCVGVFLMIVYSLVYKPDSPSQISQTESDSREPQAPQRQA